MPVKAVSKLVQGIVDRYVLLLCMATGFSFFPVITHAQQCQLRLPNGIVTDVRETPGATPLNAWAMAVPPERGGPYIVLGPTFFQLPSLMQHFTRLHECAHLTLPTYDEIAANCEALRISRMQGLSVQDEEFIANFHRSVGTVSPIYGGTGTAFWNFTIRRCGPRNQTAKPSDGSTSTTNNLARECDSVHARYQMAISSVGPSALGGQQTLANLAQEAQSIGARGYACSIP
jgi:hypothetical protein